MRPGDLVLQLSKVLERYPRIFHFLLKIYGIRVFRPNKFTYRKSCKDEPQVAIINEYEIVMDAQCLQGVTRQRGIGIYSLSLISAICNLAPEKKFAAYLTTIASCKEIETAKILLQKLGCPNLDVLILNPFLNSNRVSLEQAQDQIAKILTRGKPKAILNLSNFEKPIKSIPTPKIPNCKSVAILYDLIPLQFSGDFLVSRYQKSIYKWQLQNFQKSNLLLAISERSKAVWQELVNRESSIRVIYGAGRERFSPNSLNFNERSGLLCIGAEQPHKNLSRLIEAYGKLDSKIRESNPLTIVGIRSIGARNRVMSEARKKKIELGLPRYIPEELLLRLYSQNRLLVVPSLEEGLSLPILEAWTQGLPVVGSLGTVAEELIRDKQMLFDPYSILSIQKTLNSLLTQEHLWMLALDEIPSKLESFTWSKTATLALNAIREV